ncbi:MAG: transglutaminase-like domain-containing protein [Oscillospiraceae bacterium]|nr:transglutaminase-like domain-containing protein [Oscillospiraceae bacterium]
MKMKQNVRVAVLTVLEISLTIFIGLFSGCGGLDNKAPDVGATNTIKDNSNQIKAVDAKYSGRTNSEKTDAPYVIPPILLPEAPGTATTENDKAIIDHSNTQDGYIMAQYYGNYDKNVRLVVTGSDGVEYVYVLTPGGMIEAFPLSAGGGTYVVGIFEEVENKRYALTITTTVEAYLTNEFAPFVRPNQFVNFNLDSATVKKAVELARGESYRAGVIAAVYNYVVDNFTYDNELAKTVKTGYLPNVDSVLESGKGICFDYAAVSAAMLRSLGIPTKLVTGYAANAFHAWISVYSEEEGWINNAIFFDGDSWKLMDPTFASGAKQSNQIMQFIGDGSNYTEKFQY